MRRAVATTHGLAKSEYLSLRGVRNMLDIGDREGLVDGCRSLRLPVRMRWTGLGPRVGGAAALALECASPCPAPDQPLQGRYCCVPLLRRLGYTPTRHTTPTCSGVFLVQTALSSPLATWTVPSWTNLTRGTARARRATTPAVRFEMRPRRGAILYPSAGFLHACKRPHVRELVA